jgi:hypothetical protein
MADTDRRSRQAAPGWAGRTDRGHFLPVQDLARIERQRPVNQQACGVVVEAGRTKILCLTPIHVWRMPRDCHEGLWRSSSTRHSPNAVIQRLNFWSSLSSNQIHHLIYWLLCSEVIYPY